VIKSTLSFGSTGANGADAGRRSLLTFGIRVSLAVVFAHGSTGLAADCTDPDDLSGADVILRKSVEYRDLSSDDKKTCRDCTFFKAGAEGCGTCQILSGRVSAAGHCTSWSARASGP
jgi:High potential iron-sulfur protein